jgi:DnaJ-class molecular chaperone
VLNPGGEVEMIEDPYVTLGVAIDASQQEIARAYRRLAHMSHPDSRPDDPEASARFQALSGAYGILSDPERRARYDRAHTVEEQERLQSGDPAGQATSRSVRVRVQPSLHAQGLGRTPRPPSPPLWAGPVVWTPADVLRQEGS